MRSYNIEGVLNWGTKRHHSPVGEPRGMHTPPLSCQTCIQILAQLETVNLIFRRKVEASMYGAVPRMDNKLDVPSTGIN